MVEDRHLTFPLRGMWLVGEFGGQPAFTTVLGVNVRTRDPLAARDRGGSRTGMFRLADERVNGNRPVQSLDFVVTTHPSATLFAFDQSDEGPGQRIGDPSTSNFPNGPGPTGPGGNRQGGPFGPPNFNRRQPTVPRTIRQGGSGVMPLRRTPPRVPPVSPPSPPPPSPPGLLTRTYTPYPEFHAGEIVGTFSIGPVAVPLTPPTDLSVSSGLTTPVDYFGDSWEEGTLPTWAGTTLPTVAEINAFYSGFPQGPYQTSSDS